METAYNESAKTKKEIDIRGRFMMMACDIEYCLFNIIMFCNPDPHHHERMGQFKKMRMNAKIDGAIADMKKYKADYYKEFEEEFNSLEEYRKVRNDMSHAVGIFPNDPDLSIFRISFVDELEGVPRMRWRDYPDTYIASAFSQFSKINLKLTILWKRLADEANVRMNPFGVDSTNNVPPDNLY